MQELLLRVFGRTMGEMTDGVSYPEYGFDVVYTENDRGRQLVIGNLNINLRGEMISVTGLSNFMNKLVGEQAFPFINDKEKGLPWIKPLNVPEVFGNTLVIDYEGMMYFGTLHAVEITSHNKTMQFQLRDHSGPLFMVSDTEINRVLIIK